MTAPVTLITGASAGIGAALASVFAERGRALVLMARREPQLKAVADMIEARGRPRPRLMIVDLAQAGAVEKIDAELRAAGLDVQFLVNNAGFGLMGDATTSTAANSSRWSISMPACSPSCRCASSAA